MEFADWHARRAPHSILVVADRTRLDFSTITTLQAHTERAGTLLGLLTGADAPALSFAAAKLVLARSATIRGGVLTVDAEHGTVCDGSAEHPLGSEALRTLAEGDFRLVTVLAHGEGVHLFLDRAVLCGRTGSQELFRGRPLAGGCAQGRCKRAELRGLPVVAAAELRAERAAFLSCNSFSVAGEMYPSDSSLVLAACDGYPAAVVANPWATDFSAGEARLVSEVLGAGVTLGAAVAELNRLRASGARVGTFLLAGDPLAQGQETGAPGSKVARKELPEEGDAWEAVSGDEPLDAVFVGRSSLVGLRGASALRVVNHGPELLSAEAQLRRLAPRVRGAADLEYEVLRSGTGDDDAELALVARLRQMRLRVEHVLAACAVEVRRARERRRWSPALPPRMEQLAQMTAAWDSTFAELAARHLMGGGVVGDRVLGALTGSLQVTEECTSTPCERCGVRTSETRLRSLDGARSHVLRDCPLCGPLAFHAEGGPAITLGVPGPLRRDATAVLALTRRGFEEGPDPAGWILFEGRDKTRGEPILRHHREVAAGDAFPETVEVPLPTDAGWDQHSVRAVWIGEMEVLYARRVFVLTPDPAVH